MVPTASPLTLGLDLGSGSIGWALTDIQNKRIVAAGVRVFDPGVDTAMFEKGEPGSSKNVARRAARLRRRQLRRRAGRQWELFQTLQRAGLLPPAPAGVSSDRALQRHETLSALDDQLRAKWIASGDHRQAQLLPYLLRAAALDRPLAPWELGRALYHLGQRRGFKSNRKEASGKQAERQKQADERSEIKTKIGELWGDIAASDARTLGEFFSRLDPAEARIRARWTHRKMYQEEFEKIWTSQAPFHPERLTGELKEKIAAILFFQRPIQPPPPGWCELERGQHRAPLASLEAQRFRLLQKVNDLAILGGVPDKRPLTSEERRTVLAHLEQQGDITFKALHKLLKLSRNERFNLEAGGETKIPGDRTSATLRKALGNAWDAADAVRRRELVKVWIETEGEEELAEIGIKRFGLTEEQAREWAESSPEDGYSRLSERAIAKLLPLMEEGTAFATAQREIYGQRFSGGVAEDRLPPVKSVFQQIPNPAVLRALTELRKVVNALCRRYGKPAEIHIELARDLRRNAAQRAALTEGMRKQEKRRKKAAEDICRELGLPASVRPSRQQIEKALLWEECSGICPYCGQCISFQQLFSDHGQIEVEHILPLTRFADDSFANKTLAHRTCNQEKGNRTPFEAFGHNADLWAQILERVRKWGSAIKLQAFELQDSQAVADFTERRLNDTRYTSKLAADYLGRLYGGRDQLQAGGLKKRVVQASSGVVTATLRRAWKLEEILREPEESANGVNRGKPRTDHRHHAVDALVIALTSNSAVQNLSLAAAADDRGRTGRITSRTLESPWPGFVDSVRPAILQIRVSHRTEHRLNGALHEETFYQYNRAAGSKPELHVRKQVHRLTVKQIEGDSIVDPAVRAAVQAKLAELGDPAKMEGNWPVLVTRNGQSVPIRRVRIRTSDKVQPIGQGPSQRYVVSADNHHIAIFSGRTPRGRDCWVGKVVNRMDAIERKRMGAPVVQRKLPETPDFDFVFSLMGGDLVEMNDNDGRSNLFVVRVISEASSGAIELCFCRHTDARMIKDMKAAGSWVRIRSVDQLRERACRKVVIDPLGNIAEAHD